MRNKPKFNKTKCLKCKYRLERMSGFYVGKRNGRKISVACNYSSIKGHTCLRPSGYRQTYDLRGDDYDNCKLFEKGGAIHE